MILWTSLQVKAGRVLAVKSNLSAPAVCTPSLPPWNSGGLAYESKQGAYLRRREQLPSEDPPLPSLLPNPDTPRQATMCHRQLRFFRSSGCGHLTFTGETNIDCRFRRCYLSSSHPSTCGTPANPCNCRRYYGQPQRIVTEEVPGKCAQCPR